MQIKVMPIDEFKPSPFDLMNNVADDNKNSGLVFGFIHGSAVYSREGVMRGTYKEVRVFKAGTDELQYSEFQAKLQEPDVDIVVVVKDREKFMKYFKTFEVDHSLSKINYFLTINSITEDVLNEEITSPEATAIKRILSLREVWGFGDFNKLEAAKVKARVSTKPYDVDFQNEYNERKKMLKEKLREGVESFKLEAENYKRLYPLYFAQIWSDTAAGFPKERDKIVLPRPMDLKVRKEGSSNKEDKLR